MKKLYSITLCALTAMSLSAAPVQVDVKTVTDWKSIGTCKMSEDMLTSLTKGKPQSYEVKVEESESYPGLYRVVNPYGKGTPYYNKVSGYELNTDKDHYLYINAMDPEAVFIPLSDLCMNEPDDDWGDTSLSISSKGYYNAILDEYGYTSLPEQADEGHMGKLEDGYITFPANEIYLHIGDYRWMYDNANLSGAFYLKLPGAKNYRVEDISLGSFCASDDNSIYWNSLGGNVDQAYFNCFAGELTDEAVANTIQKGQPLIEDLGDGDYYIIWGGSLKGYCKNDIDNVTKHTIAIVTVDKDKNVKFVVTREFYNVLDKESEWQSLGKGKFTDAIISSQIGDKKPVTYEVEVEEMTGRPGYYRIVNPYGEVFPSYTAAAFSDKHKGHKHYIFIDATDPDCAILEEGPIGAAYCNNGEARISSVAAQALAKGTMTTDQLKSKKKCGKLKDGKITFPKNTLQYSELNYIATNWRTIDSNGKTALELPASAGIADIVSDEDIAPVYYNLQGVEITKPEKGIYIVRRGNKVAKEMLR